jgi:hypothetical protein
MASKITRPPLIQANPDDSEITHAINQQHTKIFRERFPNNIEQSMRLVSERLQHLLKDKGADNNLDVYYLARSLDILYNIHLDTKC